MEGSSIRIPEYVQKLKPYKAGSQQGDKKKPKKMINLAANENPLGPASKAIEAVRKAAWAMHRYPDPLTAELSELTGNKYGIEADRLVFGSGSESLIMHAIYAFAEPNEEVLTGESTFVGIFVMTNKVGRKLKTVPMKDHGFDLDGILAAITPKTRIIYLSNPNNPTGTMINEEDLTAFLDKVPSDILVILDEAYSTYAAQHEGYPNGFRLDYNNLIVMRTLSKTHGLAGVRIGFAYGPKDLITSLSKVKLPFEPNVLAQAAALAGLQDDEFIIQTIETNRRSLEMILEKFDEIGIDYVKPYANFVMTVFPHRDFAADFAAKCLENGVMVRHVLPFGVPNGVRISTGTITETQIALKTFEKVYKELKEKYPEEK